MIKRRAELVIGAVSDNFQEERSVNKREENLKAIAMGNFPEMTFPEEIVEYWKLKNLFIHSFQLLNCLLCA